LVKCSESIGFLVGLIDIFQYWNLNKKLEKFGKEFFRCQWGVEISAKPPHPYAARFLKFVQQHVFPGFDQKTPWTSDVGGIEQSSQRL
jgi:hypothetical protein